MERQYQILEVSKGCDLEPSTRTFSASSSAKLSGLPTLCGEAVGDIECPDDKCCSLEGYCGTGEAYCAPETIKVIVMMSHQSLESKRDTEIKLVDEVGGLQVHKDDQWIPIAPSKDKLVVNVGDVIQFTKGIGESPKYRGFLFEEYVRLRLGNRTHPL
ncbi:putative transcription factor TCP14-like [Capsicum annuum]|nr:putative transcription factor TCP14-like [Capsicum annuum]KAF3627104.1 putative transcription factor TCP14-like [Capsicum annuum]